MTVTSAANKTVLPGNGAQTVFSFAFNAGWDGTAGALAAALANLALTYTDATGAATTIAQGPGPTQAVVALNAPVAPSLWGLGGTVTYNPSGAPIATGTTLTILRTLPLTQSVSLQNQASYGAYASSVERGLDLLEMQTQQEAELYGRAIVVAPSDAAAPTALPPAAQRSNKALIFDINGNPAAGALPASGVISSAMQPVVNAASLAAGRAAFGLTPNLGLQQSVSGANNIDVDFATVTVSTNQAPVGANHLSVYVATGPITFTLARANTYWNGYGFWLHVAGGGLVTLAIDSHDTIEGLALGASGTAYVGNWVYVTTDGASAGNWRLAVCHGNAGTFFGNGRPFADVRAFGAKGDGVTNDTSACQAAIDSLAAFNGGIVWFSPGTYILSGGITVSTCCRLIGAGHLNTILSAGGIDVTVVTLNSAGATLEHLLVSGKGALGDTFAATQPAISTGASWVDGLILDVEAVFGSVALDIGGSDSILMDVSATEAYGEIVNNRSPGGCWFIRCKFDQDWPTGIPSGMASAVPARGNTTAYSPNQIVTSGGYILQCKTGGTSGGGAPTLKNYGNDIADGSVTWRLACPVGYAGMIISNAGQHALTMCDFTGCFTNGLLVSGAVTALQISQCTFGEHLSSGIATNAAGSSMTISDNSIFGGIFTAAGAGINIGATWSQSCIIRGNKIDGANFSSKWGVIIGGGVLTIIANNSFNGGAQAIEISPGVTDFVIEGNVISATASIKVDAGASNYYNIVNNIVHGVAVSDGGVGANKTISGNN